MEKFGIIGNTEKPIAIQMAEQVYGKLEELGTKPVYEKNTAKALSAKTAALDIVECLIVIGGDGTILHSAMLAIELDIPIFGINLGTLGFLTEIQPDGINEALQLLVKDHYSIERRALLNGSAKGEQAFALNDFLLYKEHFARTIHAEISVQGEVVAQYTCDGLIVSTPTGSTAYSLSAGGPIVAPNVQALLITPICPHVLSARPMVVHAEAQITATLRKGSNDAQVFADGRTICTGFNGPDQLMVHSSSRAIQFIRLDKHNYYERIKKKLF